MTTVEAYRPGGPSSGGGAAVGTAACIGRYSVLRELGRGGMGVTYVAYDEELDRRVVIKLVRDDVIDERAQTRLQREARALGRLTHPNIVTVHDVGRHGPQTFIAMEFVSGDPLSVWLAERPRDWGEVLDVFRQAAEGLRAAHAAGIVHRDVKPQNLVVGDDGRVRVLDFGVARLGGRGDGYVGSATPEGVARGGRLTEAGKLMGTPAYMAPEQLARKDADARSDQFSLCVSLFEALYRREPFGGATLSERLAAIRLGAIAPVPEGSRVPAWLYAVVVRGLAFDPGARFSSMDALADALARDGARPRARALAFVALGAIASAAGAAAAFSFAGGGPAVCSGARAEIAEAWNPSQRATLERALLATGASYAAETWQHTAALLDRYADDWAAAHTDACEDTAVRAEQSEAALDARMACLAQCRRSLRTLVGELSRIDAASIAGAVEAAGHLPRVASCAEPELPGARPKPPADPRVAAKVEALDADLDRAERLLEFGKYEEGKGVALSAVASAAGLGYAPIEARARVQLGKLEVALGAHDAAEGSLKEGHLLARIAGEHEATLQAAAQLVYLNGHLLSRSGAADDWARHVRAELPWVGSEVQQASALNTLGALLLVRGKHDEAIALCDRALSLWQQALGPEHPEGAKALNNLGMVFYTQGKYEQAAEHQRRVLELRERALGGDHPHVAYALGNLAGSLYRQGKHAEAAERFARALAITERALGAEHPYLADPLTGLALSYVEVGRAAEAVSLAERSLALLERQDAGTAEARFALARALQAVGRDSARALSLARQARDAMRANPASIGFVALGDVETWLRERERQIARAP